MSTWAQKERGCHDNTTWNSYINITSHHGPGRTSPSPHLYGGYAFSCTSHFEIHVPKSIFYSLNTDTHSERERERADTGNLCSGGKLQNVARSYQNVS